MQSRIMRRSAKSETTSVETKRAKEDAPQLTDGQKGWKMLINVPKTWRMSEEEKRQLESELQDDLPESHQKISEIAESASKQSMFENDSLPIINSTANALYNQPNKIAESASKQSTFEPDSLPIINSTANAHYNQPSKRTIYLEISSKDGIIELRGRDLRDLPEMSKDLNELSELCRSVFSNGASKSFAKPKNVTYVQLILLAFIQSSKGTVVNDYLPQCSNNSDQVQAQPVTDLALNYSEIYGYLRETILCFSTEAEKCHKAMERVYMKVKQLEEAYSINFKISGEILDRFYKPKSDKGFSWDTYWDSVMKSVRHVISEQKLDVDNIHRIKMFKKTSKDESGVRYLMHWRCGCRSQSPRKLLDLQQALHDPDLFIDKRKTDSLAQFLAHIEEKNLSFSSTYDFRQQLQQFVQNSEATQQSSLSSSTTNLSLMSFAKQLNSTKCMISPLLIDTSTFPNNAEVENEKQHQSVHKRSNKRFQYTFDTAGAHGIPEVYDPIAKRKKD